MSNDLLNSEILYAIAKMGHFDTLCIADAGLPIPKAVKRIDLAVTKNLPNFVDTLKVILDNFVLQKAYVASEIEIKTKKLVKQLVPWLWVIK
ncbi:hypothetical protein SCLARK_00725 [Spiroplasma clarkii]|uniref:D-ribose pyranase n=1 Tax=Spiroplasma clarkii TaxID=2139 RepID=UPI000B560DED|nr:D-ribose pyranase [Spiroplasma clarkii]ARU91376.1 hypothetical protein SCLARK_00725 [Spiroplasma clarkii]